MLVMLPDQRYTCMTTWFAKPKKVTDVRVNGAARVLETAEREKQSEMARYWYQKRVYLGHPGNGKEHQGNVGTQC